MGGDSAQKVGKRLLTTTYCNVFVHYMLCFFASEINYMHYIESIDIILIRYLLSVSRVNLNTVSIKCTEG